MRIKNIVIFLVAGLILLGSCGKSFHEVVRDGNYTETRRFLKEEKVNPDTPEKETKLTPLQIATAAKSYRLMRLLCEHGARVDVRYPKSSDKLLVHLVKNGDYQGAMVLVGYGADVNTSLQTEVAGWYEDEYPLINIAICEGAFEFARTLIEKGADVNAREKKTRMTPLHHACRSGDYMMVNLLINNKADVNARAFNQLTPLHFAAYKGKLHIVKELLAHGANIDAKAKGQIAPNDDISLMDYTAYDLAVLKKHSKTADYLNQIKQSPYQGRELSGNVKAVSQALYLKELYQHYQDGELLKKHFIKEVNAVFQKVAEFDKKDQRLFEEELSRQGILRPIQKIRKQPSQ